MAPRGDYRHREPKKSKKATKKILPLTDLVIRPEVEAIKKGKAAKPKED